MAAKVIVAGAGPVGAVLALALAQGGLQVTLLECERVIEDSPRAATVHPSTLDMLGDLGLMNEVLARGLVCRYFDHWDRPSRTLIARFDHDVLRDDTAHPFVVQIEQHKIVGMVLARLGSFDNVDVRLGSRITGFEQDVSRVTVTAERDGETERLTADYLIGTDGGRSTVRKLAGIEFEGYTWPERFLVLTTAFDFQAEWDCSFRSYFADPDEWVNLFKVAGDDGLGRWRAVFPTTLDEADEDALSDVAIARRLSKLALGANPAAQLLHRKLYRVHQRVATSFRAGRVFLAGDAAHVNNPIGGLGMNCGIHDAVELATVLTEAGPGADHAALDRYNTRRRPLNVEFIQQQTIANKKRLEEKDPAQRQARAADLAATAADPRRHRQFLLRSSLLASVAKAKTLA
jgi:2-polyprenyl-6-methoxyphenol hydroxylase-like FAD-dependent oxidoreductase